MTEKFRPYFTAEELSEIVLCLKSHPNPKRLTIARYLESFMLKIKHGVILSSHTLQPTQAEKLGFHELTLQPNTPVPIDHNLTGEAAYNKWLVNPGSATPKEIAEALDWRYRNNLMSPQEESDYEQAQLTLR